jgi:hypothetical protein
VALRAGLSAFVIALVMQVLVLLQLLVPASKAFKPASILTGDQDGNAAVLDGRVPPRLTRSGPARRCCANPRGSL